MCIKTLYLSVLVGHQNYFKSYTSFKYRLKSITVLWLWGLLKKLVMYKIKSATT